MHRETANLAARSLGPLAPHTHGGKISEKKRKANQVATVEAETRATSDKRYKASDGTKDPNGNTRTIRAEHENDENYAVAENYLRIRLDEVRSLVPRGKANAARALMHGLAATETRGSDYFTSTAVYWGARAWIEEVLCIFNLYCVCYTLPALTFLAPGSWGLGKGRGSVRECSGTCLLDDAGVCPQQTCASIRETS